MGQGHVGAAVSAHGTKEQSKAVRGSWPSPRAERGASAGLQHAMYFGKAARRIGDVDDAKATHDHIEALGCVR